MHKTVESANFHAAILGRIVTIVRGDHAFTLPLAEVDELAEVLDVLASEDDEGEDDVVLYEEELDTTHIVDELPDMADEAEVAEAEDDAAPAVDVIEAPASASDAAAPEEKPAAVESPARPARRGRMWKAVRAYLDNGDRAHGYNALLKLVKKENLTDGDPDHALKILLGRKLNAGELSLTPAGRYKLVQQKDRQRGNVWGSIQDFLGNNPDGASLDAILEAAEAGQWTKAKSTRTAVTRALKRYADHLSSDEGLFKLA